MDRATLDRLRAKGYEFDSRYDELADMQAKNQEKKLIIKYSGYTDNKDSFIIKFQITGRNLKAKNAAVILFEYSKFLLSDKVGDAKLITLNTSTKSDTFVIPKTQIGGDEKYFLKISCDGEESETGFFNLKAIDNKDNTETEKCICKKSSWSADDLRNIVAQLRKLDAIIEQTQYNGKDPYYIDKDGKLHSGINKTDAKKLKYEKYKKKTSFYERNDDVDGKPLKDRIFFYDSDKTDDNINYNLDSQYANYEIFSKYLNDTFKNYKIEKCIQKIHFLAQIYVETNRFRTTFENANNTGYSGGDFYGGRGMKQITHDYNYLNYYDERKGKDKNLFKLYKDNRETYYKKNGKVDSYESVVHFKRRTENEFISDDEMEKFENFVRLLSTSIYWACDSAGWYWNKTKLNNYANDNENAIIVVSAKVNNPSASDSASGVGINKLTDRKHYFELLKQIFDYENCK